MSITKKQYQSIQISACVVGIIILILLMRTLHIDFSNISSIKKRIISYGLWGPLVFIIFFQIRPFVLFPASAAKVIAGALWSWKGLLYIIIAETLCATWQFLASRYLIQDWAQNLIGKKMNGLHASIARNGFYHVLIVRLIPNVAFDIQNLAFGLSRINYGKFILATVFGLFPGTVLLVYFGDSSLHASVNPDDWWKFILVILIALIGYQLISDNKKRRIKKGYSA